MVGSWCRAECSQQTTCTLPTVAVFCANTPAVPCFLVTNRVHGSVEVRAAGGQSVIGDGLGVRRAGSVLRKTGPATVVRSDIENSTILDCASFSAEGSLLRRHASEFPVPILESRFRPLQHAYSLLRCFYLRYCAGRDLELAVSIATLNDLVRVANDRQVRIVRHHDDLAALRRFPEGWHYYASDSIIVEVLFRLIQKQWQSSLVYQKVEEQQHKSPLTRRQGTQRIVAAEQFDSLPDPIHT